MKRIICLVLILLMCLSFSETCFAAPVQIDDSSASSDVKLIEMDRAEETIWYFRTYNGMAQMRLWSITYRRWLTDWIDIGPVDP